MSHSISPSVLQALSKLVPDKLNYICFVEWNYMTWYLALGRENFYFISEDLTKYKEPPVPYKKIVACCLCSKRKNLMSIKLQLSDGDGHEERQLNEQLKLTYPNSELHIYS